MKRRRSDRGEAMLEAVMFAPLLLGVGLIAADFGVKALTRAELSDSIRSAVHLSLLELESLSKANVDSNSSQILSQVEQSITTRLSEFPLTAFASTPRISVEFVALAVKKPLSNLPYTVTDSEIDDRENGNTLVVTVTANPSGLFNNPLFDGVVQVEESVRYNLRNPAL